MGLVVEVRNSRSVTAQLGAWRTRLRGRCRRDLRFPRSERCGQVDDYLHDARLPAPDERDGQVVRSRQSLRQHHDPPPDRLLAGDLQLFPTLTGRDHIDEPGTRPTTFGPFPLRRSGGIIGQALVLVWSGERARRDGTRGSRACGRYPQGQGRVVPRAFVLHRPRHTRRARQQFGGAQSPGHRERAGCDS
jgi:hypothetical protein